MKICLFSFYFQPDLCAGSFRNTALVESLKKRLNSGDEIHVVTTLPNRYASFSVEAPEYEEWDDQIRIHRIKMPAHKSGFLDQINSFKAYYREARRITKPNEYDLVFASSSRLFTAYLGARVASEKGVPLYLDMRDLFRENMEEIIKNPLVRTPVVTLLKRIENYTFRKADRINIVSEGFRPFFSTFGKPITFFPNGIDDVFLENNFEKSSAANKIVTYAGNIGDGQGLHKVIPELARKTKESGFKFRIIGDGGARQELERALSEVNSDNVELLNPVGRKELLEYYRETDILFLHLNDYKAFEKVLPSKIFEYAATGKPVVAGVGGYSATFLKEHVEGAHVFNPCDAEGIAHLLNSDALSVQKYDRSAFVKKFSRKNIMDDMAGDILNAFRGE